MLYVQVSTSSGGMLVFSWPHSDDQENRRLLAVKVIDAVVTLGESVTHISFEDQEILKGKFFRLILKDYFPISLQQVREEVFRCLN